jgi:hypothetical protein
MSFGFLFLNGFEFGSDNMCMWFARLGVQHVSFLARF